MFIGVVILCAVIAFMLWLFLFYHVWLVKSGFTTNESSKKSEVEYFLERQVNFFSKWARYREKANDFVPSQATLDYYSVKDKLTTEQLGLRWRKAEKDLETLRSGNIWQPKSLLHGLKLVAFPDTYFG